MPRCGERRMVESFRVDEGKRARAEYTPVREKNFGAYMRGKKLRSLRKVNAEAVRTMSQAPDVEISGSGKQLETIAPSYEHGHLGERIARPCSLVWGDQCRSLAPSTVLRSRMRVERRDDANHAHRGLETPWKQMTDAYCSLLSGVCPVSAGDQSRTLELGRRNVCEGQSRIYALTLGAFASSGGVQPPTLI
jgi:hypothetical protein